MISLHLIKIFYRASRVCGLSKGPVFIVQGFNTTVLTNVAIVAMDFVTRIRCFRARRWARERRIVTPRPAPGMRHRIGDELIIVEADPVQANRVTV